MGYRLVSREILLPCPGLGFGNHPVHNRVQVVAHALDAWTDEVELPDAEGSTSSQGNPSKVFG